MKLKILFLFLCAAFIAGCVNAPQESATTTTTNTNAATNRDPNKKVKIGFSMATLKEERWQRDRAAFEAHCQKTNVDCVVTVANADS